MKLWKYFKIGKMIESIIRRQSLFLNCGHCPFFHFQVYRWGLVSGRDRPFCEIWEKWLTVESGNDENIIKLEICKKEIG